MSAEVACPWFSMTKIATATLAIRLADEGALDLDAPVHPLVPQMRSLRPREWAERITPRHLLQHGGGLSNPIPITWIHPAGRPGPDPASLLGGLLRKHPKLRFEPDSKSSYSNLGTLTLGAAIAAVEERQFVDVMQAHVLGRLGMTSTGFSFADGVPAATGYHPRRSPMRYLLPRWVRGSVRGGWMSLRPFLLDGSAYGGLVGTADDAARFLQAHLRGGELGGVRLISEARAEEMHRITLRGRRFDLGLGWFVPSDQRRADPPFVEHLGGGAGFFNVMRMYPTLGVGAVVMGNATRYDVHSVAALATNFA